MESRYIKDFTIALVFLMMIAFGIRGYFLYNQSLEFPDQPDRDKGISTELKKEIQDIEQSIQDRKDFAFTVVKDPLEQNLIVKTIIDIEKQWKKEVEATIRLTGTYLVSGEKIATIEYQGVREDYRVGDLFEGRKIVDIQKGKILYERGGVQGSLELAPIPEKPKALKKEAILTEQEW